MSAYASHRSQRNSGNLSRSAITRAARCACEPLEHRLMFITTTLDGTNAADTISLSVSGGDIILTLNGVEDRRSDTIFNNIEINGLGGNDTISIHSTGANTVEVNAGTGNDNIRVTPTSQDMDNIDDSLTLRGDGDTDTISLFDNLQAAATVYQLNSPTSILRGGVPEVNFATAESVVVNTSGTPDDIRIEAEPASPMTVNAGAGSSGDFLRFVGTGTQALNLQPSVTGSGVGFYDGTAVNYTGVDVIVPTDITSLVLITPQANDTVTVDEVNLAGNIRGTSGTMTLPDLRYLDTAKVVVDTSVNDSGAGNDVITCTEGMAGTSLLEFSLVFGTNALRFNSGTDWVVDTGPGVNTGAEADVTVNTATVNFSGPQTLHRLQIDNGGTAKFIGAVGSMLTTQQLAVTGGTGNLELATGQTGSCPTGGTFAIAAGASFVKRGNGTLGIAATQSHGAASFLDVRAGIMSFTTDCGSAVSRPLTVTAFNGGTVTFSATQHLAGVFADVGQVNMANNGSRVLVANAAGVGSEGGQINLNNNDMIVDFANAADFGLVLNLLRGGRAGGNWNGLGIASAVAASSAQQNVTLGILSATEYKSIYGAAATFDGQQIDNTAALIKFTYYGDADFNGSVDFDDYVRTDAGFNSGATGWLNGDFDLNGEVDFDDYVLIDLGFNSQGAPL